MKNWGFQGIWLEVHDARLRGHGPHGLRVADLRAARGLPCARSLLGAHGGSRRAISWSKRVQTGSTYVFMLFFHIFSYVLMGFHAFSSGFARPDAGGELFGGLQRELRGFIERGLFERASAGAPGHELRCDADGAGAQHDAAGAAPTACGILAG